MSSGHEFALPDLGEGLTEAEVIQWLVEVGDEVAVDQPVVEVETAKASVEVPCPYAGVVAARHGTPGEMVEVGRPLVTITPEGADSQAGESASEGAAAPGDTAVSETAGEDTSAGVLVGSGRAGAAPGPRRRRVRPGNGAAAPPAAPATGAPTAGSAPSGTAGPVPVVSPLVRRIAREHDVDLRTLTGTGPDGLILRGDVEQAVAEGGHTGQQRPDRSTQDGDHPGVTRVPLRGALRAASEKFTRAQREMPSASCWVDADATELLTTRDRLNGAAGVAGGESVRIGLLALLARICTGALSRYPELNATMDTARSEIVRLSAVHLGIAMQTEQGLRVPVLRDAHRMSTEQLAGGVAGLTSGARGGTLAAEELTGSTFTLNNYGVFGVDGSTPLLNYPEAGMLGVGRIVRKPWEYQGELALRHVVQLSFTFDHRVCDGSAAGGFLRFVADCVESPAALLRHL